MEKLFILILSLLVWLIPAIVKAINKKTKGASPLETELEPAKEFNSVIEEYNQISSENDNFKKRYETNTHPQKKNISQDKEEKSLEETEFDFNLRDAIIYSEIMNPKFDE